MPRYAGRCCECGCVVASGGLSGTAGSPISPARWKDFNNNIVKTGDGKAKRPADSVTAAMFRNKNRLCWVDGNIMSMATNVTVSSPGYVRFYVAMTADANSWLAVEQMYYPAGYGGSKQCPMIRFLSNSGTLQEINYVDFGGTVVGAYYDRSELAGGKLYAIRSRAFPAGLDIVECNVGVGFDGKYGGFGAEVACGLVTWTSPIVKMVNNSTNTSGGTVDCGSPGSPGGYYDTATSCYKHTLTDALGVEEYELDWWGDGADGTEFKGQWTTAGESATWNTPADVPSTVVRTIIIDDCDNEVILTIEAAVNPGHPDPAHGMRGEIANPLVLASDFATQGTTKVISASNLPPGRVTVTAWISGVSFQPSIPSGTATISGHGWHLAEPC